MIHTIGLSHPLFLKMVCVLYVMVPMDIKPGDIILSTYIAEPSIACNTECRRGVSHGPILARILVLLERGTLNGDINAAIHAGI